jgi:hypothetical protein
VALKIVTLKDGEQTWTLHDPAGKILGKIGIAEDESWSSEF